MYCGIEDIQKRLDPLHLIELADDDQDGVPDTAVLEALIADADARIDSRLGNRYATPFSEPVPGLLRALSADLAAAALFARRRESASPVHESRAKAALDTLDALARGELSLEGAGVARLGRPESTTLGRPKRFSPERMESL
jgi:phage gp36-like protein